MQPDSTSLPAWNRDRCACSTTSKVCMSRLQSQGVGSLWMHVLQAPQHQYNDILISEPLSLPPVDAAPSMLACRWRRGDHLCSFLFFSFLFSKEFVFYSLSPLSSVFRQTIFNALGRTTSPTFPLYWQMPKLAN